PRAGLRLGATSRFGDEATLPTIMPIAPAARAFRAFVPASHTPLRSTNAILPRMGASGRHPSAGDAYCTSPVTVNRDRSKLATPTGIDVNNEPPDGCEF